MVMANANVTKLGPDLEQWLVDRDITIMKAVPSLLRSMLIGDRRPQLPKMRLFHVGGEAVTQDIVDLFGPGRLFLNTYGSTETCSNCVIGFCAPGDKHCTIGRPLPSFQGVILHDPKADFEVNKGQLYIKSISLAKGYLNLDEKTKEVFIEHPKYGRIYATGDIVERLPEYGNCIVYRGRSDNQLKINGYRVELGEVEAKLNMISIVKEAAAVAVVRCILQPTCSNRRCIFLIIYSSLITGQHYLRLCYASRRKDLDCWRNAEASERVWSAILCCPCPFGSRRFLPKDHLW